MRNSDLFCPHTPGSTNESTIRKLITVSGLADSYIRTDIMGALLYGDYCMSIIAFVKGKLFIG